MALTFAHQDILVEVDPAAGILRIVGPGTDIAQALPYDARFPWGYDFAVAGNDEGFVLVYSGEFARRGDSLVSLSLPSEPGDEYVGGASVAQRYSYDGQQLGEVIWLTSQTNQGHRPAIGTLEGGDYLFVWQTNNPLGYEQVAGHVVGRRLSGDGATLGETFFIGITDLLPEGDSATITESDGVITVAWTRITARFEWASTAGAPDHVPTTITANHSGNDFWFGLEAADLIDGGAGDDRLGGRAGNDTLIGGAGGDTALFNSPLGSNRISRGPDGSVIVTGPEGTDTLREFEQLQFADQVVAVSSITQGTGSTPTVALDNTYNLPEQGAYFTTARLSAGGFIAAWENSDGHIVYQRFDNAGTPTGAKVTAGTDFDTHVPTVCELANGNIVVAWQNYSGGYRNIQYRVFDASDQLLFSGTGSERLVDDYVNVRVVDLENGFFVIDAELHDNFPQTGPSGKTLKVFAYDGTATGSEYQYLSFAGEGFRADLVALGGSLVATIVRSLSSNTLDVHVVDVETQTVVSVTTVYTYAVTGGVPNAELIRSPDGVFVTFGENGDFYICELGSDGAVLKAPTKIVSGAEFLSVSSIDSEHVLVAYSGGDTAGVWAKIINPQDFSDLTEPAALGSGSLDTDAAIISPDGSTAFVTTFDNGVVVNTLNISGTSPSATPGDDSLMGGIGADMLYGGAGNDTLSGGRGNDTLQGGSGTDTADFSGSLAGYAFSLDDNGRLVVSDLDPADGDEGIDTLEGIERLTFTGGSQSITVSGVQDASTGEIELNPGASTNQGTTELIRQPDGGFLVVWWEIPGVEGESKLLMQRFDAQGEQVGTPQMLLDPPEDGGWLDSAELSEGRFVLVWSTASGIFGQIFDSTGQAESSIFRANTLTDGPRLRPAVAALLDGGFVVAWDSFDTPDRNVSLQRFDANGLAKGGEVQVNLVTTGAAAPAVTGLADGGYAIVWQSQTRVPESPSDDAEPRIFLQRFDAFDVRVGGETLVESLDGTISQAAEIVALSDGGFMVGWMSAGVVGGDGYDTYTRRYDVDGQPLTGQLLVNPSIELNQFGPRLSLLPDGSYIAVFVTQTPARILYYQRIGSDGERIGPAVHVGGTEDTGWADVTTLDDGSLVIAWSAVGSDEVLNSFVQRFNVLDQGVQLTGTNTPDAITWSDTQPVSLIGGGGADTLIGGAGRDTLSGGAGADTLNGGAGEDALAGGTGDDTYLLDTAGDTVTELPGEGRDTVRTGVAVTLAANIEQLVLSGTENITGTGNAGANSITGNAGNNSLVGGGGNDTLSGGLGNDTLNGGTGADALAGGAGDDTYVVDSVADAVTELAGGGKDLLRSAVDWTLPANVEHLELLGIAVNGEGNGLANLVVGNAAANRLIGREGNDTLSGLGGADTLWGESGADTLNGGAGEDALAGGAGNDTLSGGRGSDTLQGGAGTDTAAFSGSLAGYAFSLDDNGRFVVSDLDPTDGDEGIDTLEGIERLTFTGGSQSITVSGASTGVVELNPEAIPDQTATVLVRQADGGCLVAWWEGESTILMQRFDADGNQAGPRQTLLEPPGGGGGLEAATLNSGGFVLVWTGNDGLPDGSSGGVFGQVFDSTGQPIGEVFRANSSTVGQQQRPAVASLLDGGFVVTWDSFGAPVEGIYAQRFDASGAASGGEVKVNSTMTGALGADITGLADGGYVIAWQSQTRVPESPSDDAEPRIFLQRFDAFDARVGGETLVESSDSVVSQGAEVIATPDGGYLVGWQSVAVSGGNGYDIYTRRFDANGQPLADQFLVNASTELNQFGPELTLLPDGGYIAVFLTETTPDRVSTNLFYQYISPHGDRLESDVPVSDTSDTPWTDVIALGNGRFLISWSSIVPGSGRNAYVKRFDQPQANAELTGTNAPDAITWSDTQPLSLIGVGGADTLIGGVGRDTLSGGAGADTLNGGAGEDALAGGTGDDTYLLDTAGDTVMELSGEGRDTVRTGVAVTLAANIEQLVLSGTENITGTGNAGANSITGNAGNNSLVGGGGNDTLSGGLGNDTLNGGTGADALAGGAGDDTYVVDSAADAVTELAGAGKDLLRSAVDWTLPANVEHLELLGVAVNGEGNGLANLVVGNAAANRLIGREGNDTLSGLAGADTLVGGTGNDSYIGTAGDMIVESAAGGIDTLSSSVGWTLEQNVENLVLTGNAHVGGAGNVSANRLTGNAGDNRLRGFEGADTLAGGAGNDTLLGGTGIDLFVFDGPLDASGNVDLLLDVVADVDKLQLDTDVFMALTPGVALTAEQFASGTGLNEAMSAEQRIIYDTQTGALYYDADGAGGIAALQIAVLGASKHPLISAGDFVISAG